MLFRSPNSPQSRAHIKNSAARAHFANGSSSSSSSNTSAKLSSKHQERLERFAVKPGEAAASRPLGVAPAAVLAHHSPNQGAAASNRKMMEKQRLERLDIRRNVLDRGQVKERAQVLERNEKKGAKKAHRRQRRANRDHNSENRENMRMQASLTPPGKALAKIGRAHV